MTGSRLHAKAAIYAWSLYSVPYMQCRAAMLKHQVALSFDRGVVHCTGASPEDVMRNCVEFTHTGGKKKRNYTR
jgi:hypothetical protein